MIIGKAITAGGSGLNASVLEMLPEGYKRLEYIESAGTQWIDAGLRLNQDSKLEMLISHFNTNGNRKTFGSRSSATQNNFSVVSGPVGGTMSIVTDFYNYANNRLAYVIDGDEFLEISISKEKLKINDLEKAVTTYGEFETPDNAYLFNCSGTYPAGYSPASMRLYYCRIYQNNVLVRNFIPCKNDSAEVGLYDLFEGKFYGNAGSGSFIAGNEVPTLKGNGIGCVFTVSTAAGALVKAVLENTEVSGTANADGKVTFLLNKEGLWTVSATLDGETKSTEILVEHNIEESLTLFPAEPSTYSLIGTYTSSQTWTAPENGYFQVEVFGASGNGGDGTTSGTSSSRRYMSGGGGGGGGYACSRIKMNAGDTVVLTVGDVGADTSASINSTIETYSTMDVTSGADGGDGSLLAGYSDGGAGGVATGGNYSNADGGAGGDGKNDTGTATKGGAGGVAGYTGGNAGGAGGDGTSKVSDKAGESGSAGFIKIYRGNTNLA